MNRRRLLIIAFVALALGSVVSVEVYGKLKRRIVGPNLPGVKAVIAARDLQVGRRIEENDIKIIEIPPSNEPDLPRNSFHTKAEILSRIVATPIEQGDFISPKKLAERNSEPGMTSLIPVGMRAFPLRATDVIPPGSPVAPGDRVDI